MISPRIPVRPRPKELILFEIATSEKRKAERLKLVYGIKSTKAKTTTTTTTTTQSERRKELAKQTGEKNSTQIS